MGKKSFREEENPALQFISGAKEETPKTDNKHNTSNTHYTYNTPYRGNEKQAA